jgi:hypothetical protein
VSKGGRCTRKVYCCKERENRNLTGAEAFNTECSICLSDTIELPIVLDACRHSFCFKCIERMERFVEKLALGDLSSVSRSGKRNS